MGHPVERLLCAGSGFVCNRGLFLRFTTQAGVAVGPGALRGLDAGNSPFTVETVPGAALSGLCLLLAGKRNRGGTTDPLCLGKSEFWPLAAGGQPGAFAPGYGGQRTPAC